MPLQVQKASRTPNSHHQNRTSPQHISKQNKERILKSGTEKNQIACKGKPIKITVNFSTETLK
jgi:hypothetical protein